MRRIYLDNAATTPVDPAVFAAMEPYFSGKFGNPGSLHSLGQEAIAALDAARETVAKTLGAEFRQIIFTSSATEANNLAIRGVVAGFRAGHNVLPRIIVSIIEHESVLETARALAREGAAEVVEIPVDRDGIVDIKKIKESLTPETALVSVQYANNEIGTIEPVAAIAEMIAKLRKEGDVFPAFHLDAVQAFQFLDCSPERLGADLMTISSHKIYGPKGAGALFVRDRSLLTALMTGGGQEFGMRSGTENVPAIAGFAKAAELAAAARQKEAKRLAGLCETLYAGIKEIAPDAEINGPASAANAAGATANKLPNILNVYFPGRTAEDLLTRFDLKGLAASSASACRSRALEVSYVIQALGYSKDRAKASVRFSLGRMTTEEDVRAALAIIKETSL